MKFNFSSLKLQDQRFSLEELLIHCEIKLLKTQLPEWESKIYQFIINFLDKKDYIEQLSSGTTGLPKKIKLKKTALVESADNTVNKLNLKWNDKALLCLPVDYIAGKMMIVRSFTAGLNLFLEEPSSKPNLSNYGKIDFCAMVPLQVYNSITNNSSFNNIRNMIVGGAEIRSDLLALFRDLTNNIYETFGMTETCSHIALRKISGENPDKYFEILPGVTISINKQSCLVIKTSYLESEIITNDIVGLIDSKHFIWKGRIDNLINSGGIKIIPEELENFISKIIKFECAVLGIKDEKLGQKIVLIVESEKEVDQEKLLLNLKDHLQSYQVPRIIVVVDKLPRKTSFKIDRSKLESLLPD